MPIQLALMARLAGGDGIGMVLSIDLGRYISVVVFVNTSLIYHYNIIIVLNTVVNTEYIIQSFD